MRRVVGEKRGGRKRRNLHSAKTSSTRKGRFHCSLNVIFIVRQIDAQLIYVVSARARALTEWITAGADMHRARISLPSHIHACTIMRLLDFPLV